MPEETEPAGLDSIFKDAIIVAAHPDDEILWFSSIITKVKAIAVCYLWQNSRPDWTAGRKRSMAHYPLPHVRCLDLNLSEVFDCGDWQYPRTTAFGLEICRSGRRRKNYEGNYQRLRERLQELLAPYSHVFTHNPWGEYGHEEHVQVFRAVESLQAELKFTLWVSNYVSNRSAPLMLASMNTIGNRHFCQPTNQSIAAQIRDVYIKHGCWTWYPDFCWAGQDAFLEVNTLNQRRRNIGGVFPLNFIDIGETGATSTLYKKTDRLIRLMGRLKNRLFKNGPDNPGPGS
jgi:GlcNAc-PI de-N-acetylase